MMKISGGGDRGHSPVRKKLHAKEGSRAVRRRSGAVASSDSQAAGRDANGSRRSSWCVSHFNGERCTSNASGIICPWLRSA
jgi:hypothetical protein